MAGHPIANSANLLTVLESLRVGQTVPVVMRLLDGGTREVNITLEALAPIDQLSYFVIPAFLSLVFLLISLWIFGLRRTEPAGRAFSMLTTSMAIVHRGIIRSLYLPLFHLPVDHGGRTFRGGIDHAWPLCFRRNRVFCLELPTCAGWAYAIGIILALNAYRVLYDFENPTAYIDAWG